jgi:hypothetical protein
MLRTSVSLGLCVGAVLGLLAMGASCSAFDAANDSASATDAPSGAEGSTADGSTADGAIDGDVDAGLCALAAATPTVLVTTAGSPRKVVTDGLNVFWTEGDVRLMRASLTDCSTHEVDTGSITALAANASYVVWGSPYRGLARTNLSAIPFTEVTALSANVVLPNDAYWVDQDHISSCATPCVGTSNFVPSLIAPKLIAANASHIFYFADAVVGAAKTTLWATAQSGSFVPTSLGTSTGAVLLAAASNQVYWVDGSDNLFSNDTASGIPTAHGPAGGAQAIAADDTGVYIATSDAIKRWAAGSGAAGVTLASNQGNPVSLTLTTTQLIWANATEKTLRRMLLPK